MTTIPPDRKYIRPFELAELMDEPVEKIYRWIREGRIQSIRHGRRVKVTRDEAVHVLKFGTREACNS